MGFDLNDGAFVDEVSGDSDGGGKRSAPVAAKVKNDSAGAGSLEGAELGAHVFRAVAVALVKEVDVEFGQADVTDVAAQHCTAGKCGFHFDDVAHDGNHLLGSVFFADREAHLGALFAAHLGDDFIDAHSDDVFRLGVTLRNFEELVAHLKFALAPACAAGDDACDGHELTVLLKLGSDTLKLAGHFNLKRLLLLGRKVLGVRIKGRRIRVDVVAEVVGAVEFVEAVKPLVVDFEFFGSGLGFVGRKVRVTRQKRRVDAVFFLVGTVVEAVEHTRREVVRPKGVHGGGILGVRALFGFGLEAAGLGEVHGLGQNAGVAAASLDAALLPKRRRLFKKAKVSAGKIVVELELVLGQAVEVRLVHKALFAVE